MWTMRSETRRDMIALSRWHNGNPDRDVWLGMQWDFQEGTTVFVAKCVSRREMERTVVRWTEELERSGSEMAFHPVVLDIPDPSKIDVDFISWWWHGTLRPAAIQAALFHSGLAGLRM